MGSKKKTQLWKKALVHFSLCFVMGFFTGFMPSGKTSPVFFGGAVLDASQTPMAPPSRLNPNLTEEAPTVQETEAAETASISSSGTRVVEEGRRLLVIVTPTRGRDGNRGALVRRMANTLSLVPPPVLWVVVETAAAAAAAEEELPEILRKTRVMHRHLVVRENFTDGGAEMDRQRNLALAHIEHHRISGIVHFAGLYTVYDLQFFQEIRNIGVLGTWPVAYLSANRKRVVIEGPVCEYSQVKGWHQRRKMGNETETTSSSTSSPVQISNFAFNSSILWDPERWGRTSSLQDTSQNSMKFVKQEVLEDEANLRGIPAEDCSKVMLWHLHFPSRTQPR